MKRVMIVLLAIALLPLTALAEPDYLKLVDKFNLIAEIYQGPKFDINTAKINQLQSDNYKWSAVIRTTNNVADLILFSEDGKNISTIGCICRDESNMIDYLACCCSIVSNYRDSFTLIDSFGNILFNYMMSRSGADDTPLFANDGAVCGLSKSDSGYMFTLVLPS